MIDIEKLLAPTAEEPPCGPNLEYDAAFLDLDQACQVKPEQQFGDTLIPAEEPDWPGARQRATELFARTKDLRVAVALTRALTHTDGIGGLNDGLQLIVAILSRYWDAVHPQLDPEDDNDPTMRVNALAPLVDAEAGLRDLRRAWFIRSRAVGQVSVREVEVALGKLPPPAEGASFSQDQVESMARAVVAEDPQALSAAKDAAGALRTFHGLLVEKVGAERAIDVRPLAGVLSALVQVCNAVAAPGGAEAGEAAGTGEEGAAGGTGTAAPLQVSGEIRSRADAIRLLDKVCDFLERTEPSNPAPLLIKRAKRLMTMSFVDILRDLVPDSVAQVESIAGIKQE
ncbi:MAG TPA: type VI secretion system protein TssA [Rhodocyclaceae bacterium]|nr:type VI secretion system protein TssA [Rhodocyclaceae bacterium]